MNLLHGTRNEEFALHVGLCFTASENAAEMYAGSNGAVYEVELNEDGLNLVSVAGYDRNTNTAPGDTAESLAELLASGADVIVFDDEDENGRQHECYRIISPLALAACQII